MFSSIVCLAKGGRDPFVFFYAEKILWCQQSQEEKSVRMTEGGGPVWHDMIETKFFYERLHVDEWSYFVRRRSIFSVRFWLRYLSSVHLTLLWEWIGYCMSWTQILKQIRNGILSTVICRVVSFVDSPFVTSPCAEWRMSLAETAVFIRSAEKKMARITIPCLFFGCDGESELEVTIWRCLHGVTTN